MTVYSLMWPLNKTQNSGRVNNTIMGVISVTDINQSEQSIQSSGPTAPSDLAFSGRLGEVQVQRRQHRILIRHSMHGIGSYKIVRRLEGGLGGRCRGKV